MNGETAQHHKGGQLGDRIAMGVPPDQTYSEQHIDDDGKYRQQEKHKPRLHSIREIQTPSCQQIGKPTLTQELFIPHP